MILVRRLQLVLLIQLSIFSLHALLFECQKFWHDNMAADCWVLLQYQVGLSLKLVPHEYMSVCCLLITTGKVPGLWECWQEFLELSMCMCYIFQSSVCKKCRMEAGNYFIIQNSDVKL
jgi:hypothetical protein